MKFRMTHRVFKNSAAKPQEFTETTAPDWLTCAKCIPGSTADARWFFRDHVLTLPVGGSIDTDFQTITRIE